MTTDFHKAVNSGQSLTLTGHIRLGAAWDVSSRGKGGLLGLASRFVGADIDALAIICKNGQPTSLAGLKNNNPLGDGSITHSGDNENGKADGDDEVIDFHLDKLARNHPTVDKIYLVVSAFKNGNKLMNEATKTSGFGGADNPMFKFYDMDSNPHVPLFTIEPSMIAKDNTCLMAVLTPNRSTDGGWDMVKVDKMMTVPYDDRDGLIRSVVAAG
jgi:stress response protein SCP2